MLWQTSTNRAS